MINPYKDKNGRVIEYGDIIRFYFCADKDLWKGKHFSPEVAENYTEMIDIAYFANHQNQGWKWYAVNDMNLCSSYLWRVNEYCEVIGNVWDNKELLGDFPILWLYRTFNCECDCIAMFNNEECKEE